VKYFTKQLWIDAQEPGDALEADRRYGEAFAAYARELEALRPRLPKHVFAFFESADVHDGKLIHLRVRDFDPVATNQVPPPKAIDADREDEEGPWEGPYRVGVELAVRAWTRAEWTLRYAHIRRILVDYPSEQPLFAGRGDGFEDWGYHELSDAGDGFLRHEILFSSGSIVLIEFRDVSVECVDRPSLPTAT
jgi:hypothetical protein